MRVCVGQCVDFDGFLKGILKERDPINLWILDKSRIKCGMSQVEWKA